MTKKMNAKGPVAGGIDLDAFISGADSVITPPEAEKTPLKASKAKTPPDTSSGALRRPQGRPMAAEEPRNERLQVRLTTKELAALKEKAGIASVSAYVRQLMEEKGII